MGKPKRLTQEERFGQRAESFRAFAGIFKDKAKEEFQKQMMMSVVCEELAKVCDMLVEQCKNKK